MKHLLFLLPAVALLALILPASPVQAEAEDFIKATHRVYWSAEHPSSIEVGVLPATSPVIQSSP